MHQNSVRKTRQRAYLIPLVKMLVRAIDPPVKIKYIHAYGY